MRTLLIAFLCSLSLFIFAQDEEGKSVSVSVKTLDESIDPLSVHIDVLDNESKEEVKTLESSGSGGANFKLNAGKTYIIYFSKSGYLFQSQILNLTGEVANTSKLKDVVMEKITTGRKAVLNALAFDVYQKILLDESMPDLDRVMKLLNDNPKLEVELGGYTDNIGSVSLNKKISEQRSKTLYELLESKGISEFRMKYTGYGAANPIASNFTEEGRMMNNRVEIKITGENFVPPSAAEAKKIRNNKKVEENKPEEKPEDENENTNNEEGDTIKVDKNVIDPKTITAKDTLIKIDYKGIFIADKKPMANSTVNLITEEGKVYKSTQTDAQGGFAFVGVAAGEDLTLGLDAQESKKYKKVVLADTAGNIVKELDKVNGEFVMTILPSEKTKLGKMYVADPELKIKRPPKKLLNAKAIITGKVIDDDGKPIKATIEIYDYTSASLVEKINSGAETGEYNFSVQVGKSYDITFTKFGYSFQTLNIGIPEVEGYQKNMGEVELQKVEAGKKIVLNNIFFDVNQATLRKESYSELARALKLMNDISSLSIEVAGHTDNVGSSKSNKELSEQRAKAVMDYLIEKGANKDKLTYKGYGSSKPIASNKTDAGRQLNRRTEFKVLNVDKNEIKSKEAAVEAAVVNNAENNNENIEENDGSSNEGKIPERFRKYDSNHDGNISYEEVIGAIDLYFDRYPNGNASLKEELTGLFDYYFEGK